MDEAGKILKRKRVPSTLAGVSEALGSFRAPMKAVLEASYNWGPVYDWLGEIADDVTLAHPMEVKASPTRASRRTASIRIPWPTCCAPI